VSLKKVSLKRSVIKKKVYLKKFLFKNCLKAVTIQYLPVDGGPHGAEVLNLHRFQTIFLKEL